MTKDKRYDLIEHQYAKVSSKSLKKKIDNFKTLVQSETDEKKILKEIKNVLFFGSENQARISIFPLVSHIYDKGTQLFRARVINIEEQNTLSNKDFWEAPEDYLDKVKHGRANYPKQALLYVSASGPLTCELEARVSNGDHFLLVGYKVKKPININTIGLDKNAYKYTSILSNEIISTVNGCHGIGYPSTLQENGVNLCLSKDFRERLEIDVVFHCQKSDTQTKVLSVFIIDNGKVVNKLNDWNATESKAQIFTDLYGKASDSQEATILTEQKFSFNVISH